MISDFTSIYAHGPVESISEPETFSGPGCGFSWPRIEQKNFKSLQPRSWHPLGYSHLGHKQVRLSKKIPVNLCFLCASTPSLAMQQVTGKLRASTNTRKTCRVLPHGLCSLGAPNIPHFPHVFGKCGALDKSADKMYIDQKPMFVSLASLV